VEIGYCPRCNVPLRGPRCDVCGGRPIPLRFHDLGDIRPASPYEKNILSKLIPFRDVKNYIKNRIILLSKQPGLDYRKDVFIDGFKLGLLEYVKDDRWHWRFIPTGKGAYLFYELTGSFDFTIEGYGH
jgi:phosphoadenosine phosphosulfate reductase